MTAALGWRGLPAAAATYVNAVPEMNDGKTPYTLTVKDVPVDAFWSVTLYDDKGWMPVNKYNAYSFNNVTARKDEDGSITVHFGGDPKQPRWLWFGCVRSYAQERRGEVTTRLQRLVDTTISWRPRIPPCRVVTPQFTRG